MTEHRNRLRRLQEKLNEAGFSALLATKRENQTYLTGYGSTDSAVLITPEQAFMLVDFREIEVAEGLAPLVQAVLTDRNYPAAQFVAEQAFKTLAVEETALTLGAYRELQKHGAAEVVGGDDLLDELRAVKDASELAKMRHAQELTDRCFSHLLSYIRPGLTEKAVAREIERFLREAGAERLSFETIALAGENTSVPHGRPGDRAIVSGDFLTLDFGCVVDGYCSDMTRTIGIGRLSDRQKEVYEIVLAAQLAGCHGIRAGLTGKEADAFCRDIIAAAGYGKAFGHGTGHGVGLEVHEAPTLNPASEDVLRENMAVTIEPGIYLPGEFGVRIEDLAIVAPSGIINLAESDKQLITV